MSVACFVKCWTHANIIKAIQLEEKLNCIPREMYLQIQEELARRNSKKPANAKKQKLENHAIYRNESFPDQKFSFSAGIFFVA